MFILLLFAFCLHTSWWHHVAALPAPANPSSSPSLASTTIPALPSSTSASANTTTAHTPSVVGWTSTPQVRGTFDLLLSCLTTLSLCAWTAYHPNVQGTRSEWKRMVRRLGWMIVAVFVPEIVLWSAWEQWWAARRLRATVNGFGRRAFDGVGVCVDGMWEGKGEGIEECATCGGEADRRIRDDPLCWLGEEGLGLDVLFGDGGCEVHRSTVGERRDSAASGASGRLVETGSERRSSLQRRSSSRARSSLGTSSISEEDELELEDPYEPWTMEQAFFALSGGYAIPSPKASQTIKAPNLTLTPEGLLYLARLGLLPRTSPASVSDKSKADHIAKALVCLQAGWFLIQTIARLAQKLPVTVLEVHVLAHVLCAFAMYAIWIDKPYDVGSPIMVEDERVRNLGALWACDDGEVCRPCDLTIRA